MFEKAREKYKNTEYKLVIAKIIDKYNFCVSKNKIQYSDFLNTSERVIIKRILDEEKISNYKFYGVREEADRAILILYPEKLSEKMVENNYNNILQILRITLKNDEKYEHRQYLSGILKLGIKREKFGDIIVTEKGADIVVFKEIAQTMLNGLKDLTRFRNSKMELLNVERVTKIIQEYEDMNIIISSLRLDNFVSELAKCSRTKAIEIINSGKVYLNYLNEFKIDKKININDIITIRGKGKFIYYGIEKKTKSDRLLVNIKKYK